MLITNQMNKKIALKSNENKSSLSLKWYISSSLSIIVCNGPKLLSIAVLDNNLSQFSINGLIRLNNVSLNIMYITYSYQYPSRIGDGKHLVRSEICLFCENFN